MPNIQVKNPGKFQEFGDRVYKALENAGMDHESLTSIANKMGMSFASVQKILHGKQTMSVDRAVSFCSMTNISFEWLMTGNGSMEKSIVKGGVDISELTDAEQDHIKNTIKLFLNKE